MSLRTALLLLSLAASACSAQNGQFQRSLSISPRTDVYVSTGAGHITISLSSDNRLTVVGHVKAGWGHTGDAEQRVQRILADPPIAQSGNSVHVGQPTDGSLLNNITIDYDIQAPADVALNLRTGSGDIRTTDVGRFLAANTGSGSVAARGVHGPAQLHTGSGSIELDETAAGAIQAQTGSGSIRLHGLNGTLEAHTGSGGIDADGRLQGPGKVSSGSGSIRLRVTPDSRFELKAHTGSGSIHTQLPNMASVDADHHSFSAAVNGGGPELEVHTGSGDIELHEQAN